jgi:DnaK suppressor protein
MDVNHFKNRLLEKQRELEEEISRFKENARDARSAEVEDSIDYVTSSTANAAALQEGSLASDTLIAIRSALQRIDEGSFGTCIDCGRPIELARLEAVPWTPYCRGDQEKHDRENAFKTDSQLDTAS